MYFQVKITLKSNRNYIFKSSIGRLKHLSFYFSKMKDIYLSFHIKN